MPTPLLFNANWYLSQNPDVATAIEGGAPFNAFEHFSLYGRTEGRSASPLFDPQRYLANNPDVADAVAQGLITAWDHFELFGGAEGRSPTPLFDPDFYLQQNPDVAEALANGHIGSAVQHFLLFGQGEPRAINPAINLGQYLNANPDLAEAAANGQVNPLEHLLQYGVGEGRNLGNGVSLSSFSSDPGFTQALSNGDAVQALVRVGTVILFLPTFQPPPGWAPPANTPIPVDFVPPAGSGISLVVPEGVVVPAGVTLPPVFSPVVPSSPTPAPTVPVAPPPPGSAPVAPATPTPQPDSDDSVSPRFDVSMDDQGVVTFGGDAVGDIVLLVSNGLASFTRGGTAAQTIIDIGADTFRNIVLAQDQALVASAAALEGLAIEGGGLVRVTGFDASTQADLGRLHQELTVQFDIATTTDVSGQTIPAGLDIVKVAPDAVVTLTAQQADGRRIIGEGDVVITASGQAQQFEIGTTGTNVITAGQGGDQITLGAGADVVVVAGAQAATYETAMVTFGDLVAGQSVTLGGLRLTAAGAMSAQNVAAAFANLIEGSTAGNMVTGTIWSSWQGSVKLAGFATGEAIDNQVKVTASQQGNVPDLVVAAAGRTEYATVHFHRDVYGVYTVKDTLTIGGLTLTMTSGRLTSSVGGYAAPFANLSDGATEGLITAHSQGTFSWSGQLTGFSSGSPLSSFSIVFTSSTPYENVPDLVISPDRLPQYGGYMSVSIVQGAAAPEVPVVTTTQGVDALPADSFLGTANSLDSVDTLINFTLGQDKLRLLDSAPAKLGNDAALLNSATGDSDVTVDGVSNGVIQLTVTAQKSAGDVIAAILEAAGTNTFTGAVVHENDTFVIQANGVAGVQDSDVVVRLAGIRAETLDFIEFAAS